MISCALSPNTEFEDVWKAHRVLLAPWVWFRGSAVGKVELWFRTNYKTSTAVSFNSGRSALLGILKAFGIGVGDEVILQAFTCVAVPNSVRWAGATPVYADIDDRLNIDPKDFERQITGKTKAIIVQHTFGIPAAMDEILAIAKKHKLIVIEDCAHALGATYQGNKLGTLGDAAFFSFGRDKVISSVFGGLAIIHDTLAGSLAKAKLKAYHKNLDTPGIGWIFQQVFHPVAFAWILPLYDLGIGKLLLVFFQRMNVLSKPVYPMEVAGRQPKDFPAKYPNALALLLLPQLKKLQRFNDTRQKVSATYAEALKENTMIRSIAPVDGAIYLRFPVVVDNPEKVRKHAKDRGILLGNWYHNVIDPTGVDFKVAGYKKGSCPRAEEISGRIVNLPTRISQKAAKRVLAAL